MLCTPVSFEAQFLLQEICLQSHIDYEGRDESLTVLYSTNEMQVY